MLLPRDLVGVVLVGRRPHDAEGSVFQVQLERWFVFAAASSVFPEDHLPGGSEAERGNGRRSMQGSLVVSVGPYLVSAVPVEVEEYEVVRALGEVFDVPLDMVHERRPVAGSDGDPGEVVGGEVITVGCNHPRSRVGLPGECSEGGLPHDAPHQTIRFFGTVEHHVGESEPSLVPPDDGIPLAPEIFCCGGGPLQTDAATAATGAGTFHLLLELVAGRSFHRLGAGACHRWGCLLDEGSFHRWVVKGAGRTFLRWLPLELGLLVQAGVGLDSCTARYPRWTELQSFIHSGVRVSTVYVQCARVCDASHSVTG